MIVELKARRRNGSRGDTPLRALMEGLRYAAVVHRKPPGDRRRGPGTLRHPTCPRSPRSCRSLPQRIGGADGATWSAAHARLTPRNFVLPVITDSGNVLPQQRMPVHANPRWLARRIEGISRRG